MSLKRAHIGIFGKMNAGKSTLMNLLTAQNTSLVDATPGTTADIKISFFEEHKIGPLKLFDTPGLNEKSALGAKKRTKAFEAAKEVDLVLLVIDPSYKNLSFENLSFEKNLLDFALERKKQILIIYNLFQHKKCILTKIEEPLWLKSFPSFKIDLSKSSAEKKVLTFLEKNFLPSHKKNSKIFPSLAKEALVFLNIPMDSETPESRLLRPQQMIQEHYLRNYNSVFLYRMDLKAARSKSLLTVLKEKERFLKTLNLLQMQKKRDLLITDSQALDIVHPWTLDQKNRPLVEITTFSILMANQKSRGSIQIFVRSLSVLKKLKEKDRILIAEVCNHNRLKEDIGTIQIPQKLRSLFPKIQIDHAFGRGLSAFDLAKYSLIIHCGGCMIDEQKMCARMETAEKAGVPITNYGLFLAYFKSPCLLKRVLQPLGISLKTGT